MPNNYIIYADVLFLLNFFLDFFLLWASGCFLRLSIAWTRLILASLLGAFYGAGLLLPQLSFLYPLWLKITFAFILLRIAYPLQSRRQFIRLSGVFYLMSFAMGGAVLGASSLLAGYGIQIGGQQLVGWSSLLFAVPVVFFLARKGLVKMKTNWSKKDFQVKLEIIADGRKCVLPALIDTGNNLKDPVSGKPVIVGEYSVLSVLLPKGVRQAVEKFTMDNPTAIISSPAMGDWKRRLRLVPFASIGKSHGLLLGFRPDKIIIRGQEGWITDDVIICFAVNKFAKNTSYQAVINPEIFNMGEEEREVCL
ncbi:MAG: sigma-E processing peptidase SpoIIGA [Clostridiales bacterium]